MNQQPQRIKLVIIGGAIVVLLIIILFIFSLATRLPEATITGPFARNFHHSKQINDTTIYFFSGSAFASYDLSTHKTSALTPFYTLPGDILQVEIGSQGALVHMARSTKADQFHATLTQEGLDAQNAHWWLFNFNDDSYKLLSTGDVQNAVWQDADTYVYAETRGTEQFIMRANIGERAEKLTAINATYKLVTATDTTVTYLRQPGISGGPATELIGFDLNSNSPATIEKNVFEVLAVGPDGSLIFVLDTIHNDEEGELHTEEQPRGLLTFYNAATKTSKKLEDEFTGYVTWQLGANKWLATGRNTQGQPISIRNNGDQIVKTKTPVVNGLEFAPVARTEQGDILATPYRDLYYAAAGKINNLPAAQNNDQMPKVYVEPPVQIAYDQLKRTYTIYLTQGSNSQGVEAAVQLIKSKGIDPYQIFTRWYGATGPDLSQ